MVAGATDDEFQVGRLVCVAGGIAASCNLQRLCVQTLVVLVIVNGKSIMLYGASTLRYALPWHTLNAQQAWRCVIIA